MPVSDDTAEYVPLVDWSEGEEMATRQENLSTAADQIAARIAELDTVPLTERARMSYTDTNGRQLGWTEYRAALTAQLTALQSGTASQPSLIQQAGAPFTIYG